MNDTPRTADTHGEPLSPEVLSYLLDEAATAVGALADEALRVGRLFRRHQGTLAGAAAVTPRTELRQFVINACVLNGQLGLDRHELAADPQRDTKRPGLMDWVGAIIDAQRNDKPQAIADILENEMVPFLRAWQGMLAGRVEDAA